MNCEKCRASDAPYLATQDECFLRVYASCQIERLSKERDEARAEAARLLEVALQSIRERDELRARLDAFIEQSERDAYATKACEREED